jgi:hypothetical protein
VTKINLHEKIPREEPFAVLKLTSDKNRNVPWASIVSMKLLVVGGDGRHSSSSSSSNDDDDELLYVQAAGNSMNTTHIRIIGIVTIFNFCGMSRMEQ